MDRRTLLAMLAASAFAPGAPAARIAPPDARVNDAAIRWPIGGGRVLHGYMAIPARARGRQPAVLVIGDGAADALRATARAVAQAGFVACAPNGPFAPGEAIAADMDATARWLAGNAYATGKVGAIGSGAGAAIVAGLAERRSLAAAVTFGGAVSAGTRAPLLRFVPDARGDRWVSAGAGASATSLDWADAWARAASFLREQLT